MSCARKWRMVFNLLKTTSHRHVPIFVCLCTLFWLERWVHARRWMNSWSFACWLHRALDESPMIRLFVASFGLPVSERTNWIVIVGEDIVRICFLHVCISVFDALRCSTQWQNSWHALHCRSVSSSCWVCFHSAIVVIELAMVNAKWSRFVLSLVCDLDVSKRLFLLQRLCVHSCRNMMWSGCNCEMDASADLLSLRTTVSACVVQTFGCFTRSNRSQRHVWDLLLSLFSQSSCLILLQA